MEARPVVEEDDHADDVGDDSQRGDDHPGKGYPKLGHNEGVLLSLGGVTVPDWLARLPAEAVTVGSRTHLAKFRNVTWVSKT